MATREPQPAEVLELDLGDATPAEHLCVDGWLEVDDEGRPKPCPRCRPHLIRREPAAPEAITAEPPGYRLRRRR